MALQLRRAALPDAAAIAEIHLSSRRVAMPYLPRLHSDDETRSWIRGLLAEASGDWWVACDDDQVVGFMRLEGEHLDQLYVAPAAQGRGVGSLLLAHAKTLNTRLRLFTFQRNTRARGFYEARGFRLIGSSDGADNEENEPDAEYAWLA